MADRKLTVSIVGDDSSLTRAFNRSARSSKSFGRDIERAGRGAAVATVGFRGLGRSIAFASGAFLGGAGFVAGSRAVINAASNLNEQINKSSVVFGESAAAIKKWSTTTAGSLGLSQRAALEAAGGFGQLLETAGLTEPVAAKFSKTLVGLAADLASFNNIDPGEALLKLKSGLAGEAEPLRTVGVLLSEARVKQEAYASGIAKAGSVLTEGQKVQARYNLILKDTAKQQGDFARTSDSFANASRVVKANFENLAATIGAAVLPSIARATTAFGGFLTKLNKAEGFRAKLDVVLDAGRNIAAQAQRVAGQIRDQVAAALEQIDWREVGQSISRGLASALQAIAAFVRSVDWAQVGRSIVSGIADFLKGVDWVALFKAVVRLWIAALKAQAKLLVGAAEELGKQIVGGVGAGLDKAKNFVLQKLLEFINKILGVTGFLGRFDPFKGVREKVQGRLKQMEADARAASLNIQGSIDSIKGKTVEIQIKTTTVHGSEGRAPGKPAPKPKEAAANAVADARDEKNAERRAARLAKAAAARAKTVFDSTLGQLGIALEKAQQTTGLKDDLRVLRQTEALLRERLKTHRDDLDLQSQLVSVQGQQLDIERQLAQAAKDHARALAQAAVAARKSSQFKALGLTATGEAKTPGVGALRSRLSSIEDQIKGTVLDTPKTQAQLQRIARVLAGKFGKVGKDVRSAILQMFNDIAAAFKTGSKDVDRSSGEITRGGIRSTQKLLKGLGLTPEQARELQKRNLGVSSGSHTSAFGFAVGGKGAGRPSAKGGDFNINGPITVVTNDPNDLMKKLQKKGRRSSGGRRGRHGGANLGLQ